MTYVEERFTDIEHIILYYNMTIMNTTYHSILNFNYIIMPD